MLTDAVSSLQIEAVAEPFDVQTGRPEQPSSTAAGKRGRSTGRLTREALYGSGSALVRVHVEPPEQVFEERLEQAAGSVAVLKFDGAKTEYLVATQFELAIAAHVVRVPDCVRSPVTAGEVMGAIHFEHNSLAMR